jgi:osmotically inducible protein OsmC
MGSAVDHSYDDAGLLEQLEVPRDRRLRDAEIPGSAADRGGSVAEPLDDLAADRVRESLENTVSDPANYSPRLSSIRNTNKEAPMATRNGSARWTGDLRTGSGRLTVGKDAWTGEYSWTRFAGVLAPENEDETDTNPEELLAAAHAACFSMALSLELSEAGHPPSSIDTTARVHLRVVDGAPTIQQIDLETEGDVPGVDQTAFREHAEQAKTSCIISRALGVEQINLSAALAP